MLRTNTKKQNAVHLVGVAKIEIQEFGLYSWDDKAVEDTPIKENDHAMDAIRYFVNTMGIWRQKSDYTPLWN